MDLELDDEQFALAETVRSVLAREWPASAMRHLAENGAGADQLWQRMVELDWPALVVPESDGGMGYGPVEAALVLEGCGAALVGGPMLATMALFSPLVRELGAPEQRARMLGDVASGRTSGTAAVTELTLRGIGDDVDRHSLTVTATADGDRWRLEGSLRSVIEADSVDLVVVPAAAERGGVGVFVVGRTDAGVHIDPVRTIDGTRRLGHIHLDGVVVPAHAVIGAPHDGSVPAAVRRAVDEAVTLVAAELVGTCTTILAVTLDHLKTREQFGVAIGSFQALKHRCADAYLALEAARASVLVSAVALAEGDARRPVAASTAKALAGDCAELLAAEGIQMHGGIGFTWEHDMHLYVKRALGSSALLGTAEAHRQRVADLLGLVTAP